MSKKHLRYKNIPEPVRQATAALFDAKPWLLATDEAKIEVAQAFINQVCDHYRVAHPSLQISDRVWGLSSYRPRGQVRGRRYETTALDEATITLRHWSITTLLASLREHINYCKNSNAIDSQSWALSLFYAVKPKMFRRRVREGRIPGVTERDLYSRATWNRLISEGRIEGGKVLPANEELDAAVSEISDFLAEQDQAARDEEADRAADEQFGVPEFPSEEEFVAEYADDGLDALGIVALRKLGSGKGIPSMWRLDKPNLVNALRVRGIRG